MTKNDLIELLAVYPDDMEVKVVCDRYVRPVTAVSEIVDMDTNKVSIEIIAEDKPDRYPYVAVERLDDVMPEPTVAQERMDQIKKDLAQWVKLGVDISIEISRNYSLMKG